MLVPSSELLVPARSKCYAIGAFNVCNLESVLAVTEAAVEEQSPAILAATPSAIRYAGLQHISRIVRTAAELAPVPLSLHLDHAEDVETVSKCLNAGFTSVMIDGSHQSFDKNVELTRRVVDVAHRKEASVEGELGRLAGADESVVEEKDAVLTDPEAASKFAKRTGVDALAVAVGTSHGAYKFRGEPSLDFDRLRLIGRMVPLPLVLHGASSVCTRIVEKATKYGAVLNRARGIPDEQIAKAVSFGIAKINIDTDLKLAWTASMREILADSPAEFDPKRILEPSREAMKQVIKGKMQLFGSSGKATGRKWAR